ncbi:2-amino-3-carboxymuconate-6-semialdehyde decarboxylase [Apodospora peruviana]|uniref:2-amino-3-carboxymuconate-6-semialdehyde decarboxylase n=1 Tax=Apodospora peruviana TaxID=516989 RepID=A0AAE0IB65_9PEZI|nr:2-amino-3-carboxymuconate-6-semialdehyde decarboxylase [Apodospora peruviana]
MGSCRSRLLVEILSSTASESSWHAPQLALPKKLIALEEHSTLPSLGAGESIPFYAHALATFSAAATKLFDLGPGRLREMDTTGVTLQVLSCTAGVGVSNPTGCRGANDELAAATHAHPSRVAAFAILPMAFPNAAAAELERAVTQLGTGPCSRLPERLSVALYLHPALPSPEEIAARYTGNYSARVAAGLASGGWGWHADAGLSFLKMVAVGVFDTYPKLKIVLVHNGEMVPAMLDRASTNLCKFGGGDDGAQMLKRGLREVWGKNVWVTTSGMYTVDTFAMLLVLNGKNTLVIIRTKLESLLSQLN